MGNLEDIRRFDTGLIVSIEEINPEILNRLSRLRPTIEHKFTSDLCHRLILWVWTRKITEVVFTDEANDFIFETSGFLCEKYSESFPLVDRGTMRHKIARLAAAIAGRTFSCEDGNLIIRKCHVEFIREFLDSVYSSKIFGYSEFSKAQEYSQNVIDENAVINRIKQTKFSADLVENLLFAKEITPDDLSDWCDLDLDHGKSLISFFVRKHAIRRIGKAYFKTAGFILLLRKLKDSGVSNIAEPDLGKDEF
jgi:hypothetical protein